MKTLQPVYFSPCCILENWQMDKQFMWFPSFNLFIVHKFKKKNFPRNKIWNFNFGSLQYIYIYIFKPHISPKYEATFDINVGLTVYRKAGRYITKFYQNKINLFKCLKHVKLVMYYVTVIEWPCIIDRKGGAPSQHQTVAKLTKAITRWEIYILKRQNLKSWIS